MEIGVERTQARKEGLKRATAGEHRVVTHLVPERLTGREREGMRKNTHIWMRHG